MPHLSSLWRKKKEKNKERELSISQRKSYKTSFKQYATVDSAFGAHAINAPDRDNVHTHADSGSATYMGIGRAGMPLVAALAYHRAPTWTAKRKDETLYQILRDTQLSFGCCVGLAQLKETPAHTTAASL